MTDTGFEMQAAQRRANSASLAPLIDRADDLATLTALLHRADTRLVSLTGAGGVGKTSLAVHLVATQTAYIKTATVWLAALTDPAQIMTALAAALGVAEAMDRDARDGIVAALHDQKVLVLLDNFEHLLNAAPSLTDLLADCPLLTLLVTSRTALRLRAEHEYSVEPLAVPDTSRPYDVAALNNNPSVALFVRRAQEVRPDFRLTAGNAAVVAQICTRLDGLPLALELAAARVRVLTPAEIVTRLDRRFQVLTSGGRDLPHRQQTLRNTLDWSYGLLNAADKQTLRRVAVFIGECDVAAAEVVCGTADDNTDEFAVDVLNSLETLIDSSLMRRLENGGTTRLTLLETLREYALEQLQESGEENAIMRRYAAYYIALAEKAKPHVQGGAHQKEWLDVLEREHINLRRALQWLIGQHTMQSATRLALALEGFWLIRGHIHEGRQWLEEIVQASDDIPVAAFSAVLNAVGMFCFIQTDFTNAVAYYMRSLALFRQLDDSAHVAETLHNLSKVAVMQGDLRQAAALLQESLALQTRTNNTLGLAHTFASLGDLAIRQGSFAQGKAHQYESLRLYQTLHHTRGIAGAYYALGMAASAEGAHQEAKHYFTECLATSRDVGDKRGMTLALTYLAWEELVLNHPTQAIALYRECMVLAQEIGEAGQLTWGLQAHAVAARMQGQPEYAVWLFGAAATLRETLGMRLAPLWEEAVNQEVARAQAHLDSVTFDKAWAKGRALTVAQAVELALHMPVLPEREFTPTASSSSPTRYPDSLTAREIDVLRLVAKGMTNAQIAQELVLTTGTVNAYLHAIYGKLGITSRSIATRYAIEHNLA